MDQTMTMMGRRHVQEKTAKRGKCEERGGAKRERHIPNTQEKTKH